MSLNHGQEDSWRSWAGCEIQLQERSASPNQLLEFLQMVLRGMLVVAFLIAIGASGDRFRLEIIQDA